LDELDKLVTKKQTVLYNFFDWPTKRTSNLIVIGIANTFDLPERLFPRVYSRLGRDRLTFAPYTRQQLLSIMMARLETLEDVFDCDAIQFCAAKVASVSGDARRAVHIVRRATEIAEKQEFEQGKRCMVNVRHLEATIAEMSVSHYVEVIRACSFYEKLVIFSLFTELRQTGASTSPLNRIFVRLQGIDETPSQSIISEICVRLSSSRLITGKGDLRSPRFQLSFPFELDQVLLAFHSDPFIQNLLRCES